jgi:hypothetical protein
VTDLESYTYEHVSRRNGGSMTEASHQLNHLTMMEPSYDSRRTERRKDRDGLDTQACDRN